MLLVLGTIAKVGIPFAIGWIVDLALEETDREKPVKRTLDHWWDQFDKLTWFHFGQEEGKTALRIFDRVFGAKLWSWRRWLSVILILVASMMLAIIVKSGGTDRRFWLGLLDEFPLYTTLSIAPQIIGMALSLSATRWLSSKVVLLTGFFSILGFAGMLVLSIVLIEVWAPMVTFFKQLPGLAAGGMLSLRDFLRIFEYLVGNLRPWLLDESNPARIVSLLRPSAPDLVRMGIVNFDPAIVKAAAFAVADYFVSMVRVGFSSFFLFCFLLRRFVHRPLVRLGFIWLTSGKPIFATLFGAISLVIVALHELSKLP